MFYLEWTSFYSFFILFDPRGPAYHGFKKTCFFLEQGIVRVRANSLRRREWTFSLALLFAIHWDYPGIYAFHTLIFFSLFFLFFLFFFYLWSNKRRCCDEVHKAIMAINFTSRHGFSSFPNKKQSKK